MSTGKLRILLEILKKDPDTGEVSFREIELITFDDGLHDRGLLESLIREIGFVDLFQSIELASILKGYAEGDCVEVVADTEIIWVTLGGGYFDPPESKADGYLRNIQHRKMPVLTTS